MTLSFCRRPTTGSPKLLQKSHIPLKEQLQIVQTILQHGDTVHTHAESEARNFLGIVTVVLHELGDIGIDHAAAEDFERSRLLAGTARLLLCSTTALATPATNETRDEHLRAWFGERKERWAETGLHVGAEQRFHRVVERTFQIAEGDVRVNGEALDLMEHRRMAGVGRIVAMHLARNDDANWRLQLLHSANLHRRSMRAQ